VFKLLNSHPEQRYQTAATLLADLQRIQHKQRALDRRSVAASRSARGSLGLWLLVSCGGCDPISPPAASDTRGWTRLTSFADSVSQPALSRDGRLLAFIRSSDTFNGAPGEIFVKQLPDGEPVQLTRDGTIKMGPAPDAARLAYTVNAGGMGHLGLSDAGRTATALASQCVGTGMGKRTRAALVLR
jgi:hypothetical protein